MRRSTKWSMDSFWMFVVRQWPAGPQAACPRRSAAAGGGCRPVAGTFLLAPAELLSRLLLLLQLLLLLLQLLLLLLLLLQLLLLLVQLVVLLQQLLLLV